MIELKKEDIRQIAINRYHSGNWRRVIVFVAILIAGAVLLGIYVPDTAPVPVKAIGIGSVTAYYLAGVIYYVRASERYIKGFIAQCEADPELRYTEVQSGQ